MRKFSILFVLIWTFSLAQINGYPMIKPTAFEPYLQPPAPALAGLWLDTNPGIVWMGGNPTTIPVARVHLTASATNYVYVNLVTNTIQVNTTGFGSVIYPIAIVSTNNTQTTTVQDVRPDVYGAGGGGGGGGANIEVNNVSNSDQTILNFTDASGIHFGNPSGGIVTATVTGNILPETVTTSLPSDTGSVNAYAACPSPTNPSLAKGLQIPFIPANTNTTTSTFNLCSGGAVAIKKQGATALTAGDIVVNAPITLTFDGSVWQDPTPMANGVTSFNTRTGAVVPVLTDYQGMTQVGSGTLNISCTVTGTCKSGNTSNFIQINPIAASNANSITIRDSFGNAIGLNNGSPYNDYIALGTGISSTAATLIVSDLPKFEFDLAGSIAGTWTSSLFSVNQTFNFAGTIPFQIGGSVGSAGQCVTSNGTTPSWGACATGTVATVSGTANQIINTGSSSSVVLALASPLVPPGNVQITQLSNGGTALSVTRKQDSGTPSGNLLLFQTAGLSPLGFVDVFGNQTMPSYTTNGTGAGWNAQAAGTDNGANCLTFLTNLSVTGRCIQGPASIVTSWVESTPTTAPAAFSVLAVEAAAGSPLEAAQHYVQTTDPSSPARIQSADTTVGSAPSGDILTSDGGGNSHDSGTLLSSITTPTCATATITQPVTCGGVDTTGIAAAGTTTNNILSVTVPAGQYQLSSYINATSTNCVGTSPAGTATSKIVYSDSNGSTTKQAAQLVFATSLPGNGSNASAVVTFWIVAPTSTMNVQLTWAVCSTSGGDTVDSHFTLLRLR